MHCSHLGPSYSGLQKQRPFESQPCGNVPTELQPHTAKIHGNNIIKSQYIQGKERLFLIHQGQCLMSHSSQTLKTQLTLTKRVIEVAWSAFLTEFAFKPIPAHTTPAVLVTTTVIHARPRALALCKREKMESHSQLKEKIGNTQVHKAEETRGALLCMATTHKVMEGSLDAIHNSLLKNQM